jgi:hypothetical protein
VKTRLLLIFLLGSLCISAYAQAPPNENESTARVRRIILNSRHLGAHGLGYNDQSLETMSRKLTPSDIPILVSLSSDTDLRVGAQFALASQCEAAIFPVRDAAVDHRMSFLDAQDTMLLMKEFNGCASQAQQRAAAMRSEIHTLEEIDERSQEQQAQERAAEDARIQQNGLKILDPKQAKQLTRQEREEVYRRSLKAMGLTEDGPMTPEQRDLVQRMYRTMVLGESGNRPPN